MPHLAPIIAALLITNASDFATLRKDPANDGRVFVFEGVVAVPPSSDAFMILDDCGRACMFNRPEFRPPFSAGDRVRTYGNLAHFIKAKASVPICERTEILSRGSVPKPLPVSPSDLKSGKYDNRFIRISGKVEECFSDDTDSDWVYLAMDCDGETLYAASPHSHATAETHLKKLQGLVGARIAMCCIYSPEFGITSRRLIYKTTVIFVDENSIETLGESPNDPFDVPDIGQRPVPNLSGFLKLRRCKVTGQVIAIWQGDTIILRTPEGEIHNIELSGGTLPKRGDMIEVAGNAETDLCRINLNNATWRPVDIAPPVMQQTALLEERDIIRHRADRQLLAPLQHGNKVRIVGLVQDISKAHNGECTIQLKCHDDSFAVTAKADDAPEIGSTVEVTGICIVETTAWRPHAAFPRIKGVSLLATEDGAIRIVSRPPWWTPFRLLVVIGALLAVLAAILVWNYSLRRMAERRSRLYLKAKLARMESELKVGERTRLSVELHDTLSQNLIGASMEINTAEQMTLSDGPQALRHLDIASKTLKSCRDELRNCLWDLRSQALEEPDMDKAIRKTLEPYISDIDIQIRFNVPRSLFTDNTAHALMRIIRELVLNAVRHGKATAVKIAGGREGDTLFFSVRDNGCGFDPSTASGIAQGHFGLQGVRERLRLLKGTLTIESSAGHGTKATARLQLPKGAHEKA